MTDHRWNRRQTLTGIASAALWAGMVRAAPTAGTTLNFLVVGDWGRDGTNHQRDVATQMGRTAAANGSACVISVGDNFYDDGVASVTDRQWRTSFEDIYTAASLQVPWYAVLGNHDYRGTPQAQVDYSAASPRWRMPRRYYTVSGATMGAPHLDLFFIDTSPLVHKYREKVDSKIAVNVATQDVDAQLRWLDTSLAASSARWKLVIGHHTLRSGGSAHGETPEIVAAIDPLLRRHGVQAYINGHDHDLQHIRRGGVNYIGSGAGSEVRPVKPVEGTLFCAERSGFASLTSAADALQLEFRDFGGASLYQATIVPG